MPTLLTYPRIGVDENVAFPAVQANVAPAIALKDALGVYSTIDTVTTF